MERRNMVLITVDSLRADAVNNMPFLKSCHDMGFNISKTYANGPSTPFSFPSLFNLDFHPFYDKAKIKSPTIVEKYKKEGYSTLGIVANNPYISSLSDYDKGFSYFEDYMSDLSSKKRSITSNILRKGPGFLRGFKNIYKWYFKSDITSSKGSLVAIQDAGEAINRKQPFFLWLHLMDTHYPYTPPRSETGINPWTIVRLNGFRKRYRLEKKEDPTTLNLLKILYKDCVVWTDKVIKRFFSILKDLNLWSETDVIITADHGEGFYEHGFLGHPAQLYNELVQVPLAVRVKELESDDPNFIDLREVPVLLDNLITHHTSEPNKSIKVPKEVPLRASHAGNRSFIKGNVNLIGRPDELPYNIYGVVKDGYKLIYDDEDGTIELYDITKDPHERRDISKEKKNILNRFKKEDYPFL